MHEIRNSVILLFAVALGCWAQTTALRNDEYDASYFDGAKQATRHNAGYSRYERWYRNDGPNSTGEYFRDIATRLVARFDLVGKKVLVVGCAKGFIVKDMRDLGVDAWGFDISPYAIGEAEPEVQPFIQVADARTHLATYRNNQWDVVFSRRVLECFRDEDLTGIITEMNRISRLQIHIIADHAERVNDTFYNLKPLESWLSAFSWNRGTQLLEAADGRAVTK